MKKSDNVTENTISEKKINKTAVGNETALVKGTNSNTAVQSTSKSENKITKQELEKYLSNCLQTEDAFVSRTLLKSVRANLSCAFGEDVVDDTIAFGYLQVNTGRPVYHRTIQSD